MKKNVLLLTITALFLISLMLIPVQAQTIIMANPGGIADRDIIVYYPNGTMQGYYNTTSVISLSDNQDYIFTLKPIGANPLEDPGDFLQTAFDYVQSNVIALIVLFFLIGLFFMGSGRKR